MRKPAHFDLAIVVDVANVMGARADGWWKDRAGAALRLRQEVSALASRGLAVADLPPEALGEVALGEVAPGEVVPGEVVPGEHAAEERCFPCWVLVLEGRARAAASASAEEGSGSRQIQADAVPLVRLVLAPASGDDAIAEQVAGLRGCRIVVTADRELRRRCEHAGAIVTGPRWLLGLL